MPRGRPEFATRGRAASEGAGGEVGALKVFKGHLSGRAATFSALAGYIHTCVSLAGGVSVSAGGGTRGEGNRVCVSVCVCATRKIYAPSSHPLPTVHHTQAMDTSGVTEHCTVRISLSPSPSLSLVRSTLRAETSGAFISIRK